MTVSIFSEGKEFISASRAAEKIGYASDYIGQLCRAKKIPGKLIGRTWYVDYDALQNHKQNKHIKQVRQETRDKKQETNLGQDTRSKKQETNKFEVPKINSTSPQPRLFKNALFAYEKAYGSRLPELSRDRFRIQDLGFRNGRALIPKFAGATLALILAISGASAVLPAERLSNGVSSNFSNLPYSSLTGVSFLGLISGSLDFLADGFNSLKQIAIGQFLPTRTSPTSPALAEAKPTSPSQGEVIAVTQTTPTYNLDSFRAGLKSELESYVRAQIGEAKSPVTVYNTYSPVLNTTVLREEILLADTRPTVTRQSNSDSNRVSTIVTNLTNNGTFENSSITGASISNSNGQFNILEFTIATGTSATTTNFFSTNASTTNFWANVGSIGFGTLNNLLATGSTTLQNFSAQTGTLLGNLLVNGSTTLQNFTASNSTTTNATSSTFAITGNGAGLLFTGSGNHDITATGGTLRIGANTIIGNILPIDNTIDIGAAGTRFDIIYANEVNASNVVGTIVGGNVSAESLRINSDNATADTEDSFLEFERGSLTPNGLLEWDSASDNFIFNSDLTVGPGIGSGALLVHGSSTLQNFTFRNATGTAATTTDLYVSNLASTTALRVANTAYIGGNTGIGTAAPDSKLHVFASSAGSFTPAASTVALFESSGGTGLSLVGPNNSTLAFNFASPSVGDGENAVQWNYNSGTPIMYFYTGNAQRLALGAGGAIFNESGADVDFRIEGDTDANLFFVDASTDRIGVGTTTPNNKLDIYSTTKSAIGFSGASGNTYKWTLGMDVSNGGRFSIASSTALGTNDIFVINGAGNVGIGTTNPGSLLDVRGQVSTSLGSVSAPAYSFVGDLNTGIWSSGADTINFSTGGGERLRVMSGGTVLVGGSTNYTFTASGNLSKLQINGVDTDSSTVSQINWINTAAGSNYFFGKSRGGSIGTRGIVQSGDVLGSIRFNGDDGATFYDAAQVRGEVDGTPGTADMPGRLTFWTTADGASTVSERMRIDSSGNVGIGTMNPGSFPLQVYKTGANNRTALYTSATDYTTGIAMTQVGGGSWDVYTSATDGDFRIDDTTSAFPGTNRLFIKRSTGNVGIGTTTPSHQLTVSSSTAPQLLLSTGANNNQWAFRNSGGQLYIATSSPTSFATSSKPQLVIDGTTGYLGIGTTTPGEALDINGGGVRLDYSQTGNVRRAIDFNPGGYGYSDPSAGGSNALGDKLVFVSGTGQKSAIGINADVRTWFQSYGGASTGGFAWWNGTTQAMVLDGSGRLGVGTTTPSGKLSVTNTGEDYSFIVEDSTSPDSSPFVIAKDGHVGIGTTAPGSLDLSVHNQDATVVVQISSNNSTGGAQLGIIGNVGNQFQIKSHSSGATGTYFGVSAASTNLFNSYAGTLLLGTETNNNVIIGTNNTERIRITGGGNVGIGTTTPQWKTQISSTAAPQLTLSDSGLATSNHFSFRNSNGILYVATSSPTSFATSTTPALTVDGTTGRVGIGTEAPLALLDVRGSIYANVGNNNNSIFLDGQSRNGTIQTSFTGGDHWSLGYTADRATYGTPVLTWKSPGLVGIGTTTPSHQLTIASSTGPQLTLTDGVSGANPWSLRARGGMLYFATSSQTSFATSTKPAFVIDGTTGYVGIGTTTPGAALDVNGGGIRVDYSQTANVRAAIEFNKAAVGYGAPSAANANSLGDKIVLTDNGTTKLAIGYDANARTWFQGIGGSTGGFEWYTGSSPASVMLLDGTGKLGVGTTDLRTGSKLVVSGGNVAIGTTAAYNSVLDVATTTGSTLARFGDLSGNGASGAGYLQISHSLSGAGVAGAYEAQLRAARSDYFGIYSEGATGQLWFGTNSTERMRINAAGNIGVGTTTPSHLLTLASSTAPQLLLSTGANNNQWAFRNSGGMLYFATSSATSLATSTTPALAIDGTRGNVGIGTANPSFGKLSIQADSDADALGISGYQVLKWNNSNQLHYGGYTAATWTNLGFWTSGSQRLTIDTSGNVGVGTTTPSAKLSVTNTGNDYSFIVEDETSADATPFVIAKDGKVGVGLKTPVYKLDIEDAGNPIARFKNTSAGGAGWLVASTDNSWGAGGGKLIFLTDAESSGTADLVISDGAVGIGATSPAYGLDVGGTAGMRSSLALWGIANGAGTAYLCQTLATGAVSTSTSACNPSSMKYKENVEDLSYGLAEVLNMRPVAYDYKPELLVQGHQVGFIAEEMHEIIPEVVGLKDGEPDNIDYAKLTSVLVKAIKELYAEFSELKTTVLAFAERFVSREIVATERLCVGSTCINEEQLQFLISNYSNYPNQAPSSNNQADSTTPTSSSQSNTTEESTTEDTVTEEAAAEDEPDLSQPSPSEGEGSAEVSEPESEPVSESVSEPVAEPVSEPVPTE